MTLPASSLMGEMVRETQMGWPSLRSRTVSKCSIRCPAFRVAMIRSSSAMRSAGMIERDVTAHGLLGGVAEQPLGGGVPALNDAVQRLADDGVLRRLDDRRQQAGGRQPAGISSSKRRRSVTSRKTSTQPTSRPARPGSGRHCRRSGAPCRPWRIRTVWLASPTTTPSRSARVAGFSTGWRVSSLTMRNTASSGWPAPPPASSRSTIRPRRSGR